MVYFNRLSKHLLLLLNRQKSIKASNLNKYQLLLMNPHDARHHGKRAGNKGECSVW